MKKLIKILTLVFFSGPLFLNAQNQLVSGEYWFDQEIENKTALTISPSSSISISEDIDVSSLIQGLHTLHIRFRDDNNRYSPAVSAFFIKSSDEDISGSNSLQKYEYWFNGEKNGSVITDIGNQPEFILNSDLDVANLGFGLHTLSIRFLDAKSKWSPAVSKFFIHSATSGISGDNKLSEMEYWFDNQIETTVPVSIPQDKKVVFIEDIDINSLSPGLHTINLRFRDENQFFSPAVSKFFIHSAISSMPGDNNLSKMEYWFDNQIENSIEVSLSPAKSVEVIEDLAINSLSPGLHTLNLRFRDEGQLFSPALSRFFIKLPDVFPTGENKLAAYRYWFDDSEIVMKNLSEALPEVVLIDSIDMKLKQKGEYILHLQFMDEQGLWSSPISDTVDKLSLPFASLSSDQLKACLNDSILFSAMVVDADSISWDFGDLGTSSELSLKYAYALAGTYQVSATIVDTLNDISATFELENDIEIYNLPVIDLGDNIDLCTGDQTNISGPAGMTAYSWSNGANTESIIVETGGRYYLVVEDANECLARDSVDVTLRALPVIDIGDNLEILETETHPIDAGEGFASYTWNDITGTNLYTVSGAELGLGEHMLRVKVENEFGCFNSDTLYITVSTIDGTGMNAFSTLRLFPNPAVDFMRIEWNESLFDEIQVSIISLQGKPMMSKIIRQTGEEINVSNLNPGNYFMIMKAGSEIKTVPIVKL